SVVGRPRRSSLFPYATLFRSLRIEGGGLRFDIGGLWGLAANLIGQFIGALFAGPREQLPDPRRFEAPDPYMYGIVVAREQRSERSEEHTSELQSRENLVCRLL